MGEHVISFSLYGDDERYREGTRANLALAPTVYPGWTVRCYVSEEIPESLVGELASGGAQIVRRRRRTRGDGLFWRFLPAGDPGVDVCVVRDVDSRLGWRERRAVDEWLASGRGFHIMRDHPEHRTPIMGGMWGARRGVLADIEQLMQGWDETEHTMMGPDQDFLAAVVYPRVRDDALVHSGHVAYPGETVVPFPPGPDAGSGRPEPFVGAVHGAVSDDVPGPARLVVLPPPRPGSPGPRR